MKTTIIIIVRVLASKMIIISILPIINYSKIIIRDGMTES